MKAILVIDMPNDIDISKVRIGGDGNIYFMRDGERASIVGNIRNIKPLPKEEEPTDEVVELGSYNEGYGNGYECGFADGWNACLKEITK